MDCSLILLGALLGVYWGVMRFLSIRQSSADWAKLAQNGWRAFCVGLLVY
ncbi:MAG: hypothetical protein OD811_00925 [Alphaproteobacteria bacterium]